MRSLFKWIAQGAFVLGFGLCAEAQPSSSEVGRVIPVNQGHEVSDGLYSYEISNREFIIKVESAGTKRVVFREPMEDYVVWVGHLGPTRLLYWTGSRSTGLIRVLDLANEVKSSERIGVGIYNKILSVVGLDFKTFVVKVSYRYVGTIGTFHYRRSIWTYTVGDDLVIVGQEKVVCNGSYFPGHDDWRSVPYCVVQAYNGVEEP